MITLKINEDYKLAPLTQLQYTQLEQNIIEDGCRDAICVLTDYTIIDGHARYEICKKHNIDFEVDVFDIEPELVKNWIAKNQNGKRNIVV